MPIMIDSENSNPNSSNIKEPISARLYGGIFVIGFLGLLGFVVNLFIEKYVILGKILSPIILISLLLLSYTWLSVFIYQMTRNRTFVIDFEYAFNQKLDISSSNKAICSMELKAAMYPPTAKTSNFGNCTTPDNLPEPFLEIEKNKYKEYRYKNRKKSNLPLPNISLQEDKSQ